MMHAPSPGVRTQHSSGRRAKRGHQTLVTVAMIFLNAEKFIREAVESVLAQTYGRWELLLIDDGSNDRSTAIARGYARNHPRKVRYFEHAGHRNLGMSTSRNLGIRQAKGEFITFLDADDVWLKDKLQDEVTLLESHTEVAFLCAPAQYWYSWTGTREDAGRDFIQHFAVPPDTPIRPPALLTQFLQDEWASLHGIVVRCTAMRALGGYEESFRGMYEDQAFLAKLCTHYSCYVAGKCGYCYRQHPDACTAISHRTGKTWHAREDFLRWLEGYLARSTVNDVRLRQVLRKVMYPFRHPVAFRALQLLRRTADKIHSALLIFGSEHHSVRWPSRERKRGVSRRTLPVGGR